MNENTCLFTGVEATRHDDISSRIVTYDSKACGRYAIYRQAETWVRERVSNDSQGLVNCARRSLEIAREGAGRLAYWVGRNNLPAARSGQTSRPDLVPVAVEDVIDEPVDHASKPIWLLEALASRLERAVAFAPVSVLHEDRVWARIPDPIELFEVLHHLVERGLLRSGLFQQWWDAGLKAFANYASKQLWPAVLDLEFTITVEGWAELRERGRGPRSNKVFIASQFVWPSDQPAPRAEVVQAIRSACAACGYEAEHVSQDHTGFVTDRIIAEIRHARFVVAELTHNNRGVYFEAGYARGLGIPVFHVVHADHVAGPRTEGREIHFDIAQVMYRTWKEPSGLEQELRAWIEGTSGTYADPRR